MAKIAEFSSYCALGSRPGARHAHPLKPLVAILGWSVELPTGQKPFPSQFCRGMPPNYPPYQQRESAACTFASACGPAGAGCGMKQQVLDWLAEFEAGAECSAGLEALSTAVQQDPVALATLVRAGGLSHVVTLLEKDSASVATILVVASEEYAQELVEADALAVIVGLVTTEANQEDAAWALGCVDTYVPGPPHCTYGLRLPASCVLYVLAAQGSRCPTVRTPYAYPPRACRTYRVPWGDRWPARRASLITK